MGARASRTASEIAGWYVVSASAAVLACMCGCAAPGPPLPPTLNLPQVVSGGGLTAMRVGGDVRLRWTMAKQTTDKLPVKGAVTAEICRDVVASGAVAKGVSPGSGCAAVLRVAVVAGESEVVDTLPEPMAEGPVRLLAYRVRLLNSAGRTAGLSPVVYAAGGSGAAEVAAFVGEVTRAGVELRWQAGAGGVELERTLLDPAQVVKGERKMGLPGAERQATDVRLRAGEVQGSAADAGGMGATNADRPGGKADAGGMVDRTVEVGHSYRYSAQRVVAMTVDGQAVELRSVESGPLTFAVRDVFAPRVPAGLVAVPAFGEGGRAAIDLAWDAVMEQDEKPRLAGYTVYRRDGAGGMWKRLGVGLVRAAAYRDMDVVAGQRYAYRVTATSTAGNESAPSNEAVETAAQMQ